MADMPIQIRTNTYFILRMCCFNHMQRYKITKIKMEASKYKVRKLFYTNSSHLSDLRHFHKQNSVWASGCSWSTSYSINKIITDIISQEENEWCLLKKKRKHSRKAFKLLTSLPHKYLIKHIPSGMLNDVSMCYSA